MYKRQVISNVEKFMKIHKDSLLLTLIYTSGHILIAMTVVRTMTGASLWESGAVALIEPAINGVWFYVIHRLWKRFA